MTMVHNEFLELAAAGIDFELNQAERDALESHLAGCIPCRRRLTGLHGDQRAITQLPPYVIAQTAADKVRYGVRRSGGSRLPALRLVALAAVLTLLALAAIAVGAEVLRREHDVDLTVVRPTVTNPVVIPTASIAPAPTGPAPTTAPGVFAVGSTLEIVVNDLRVRTAPTVDATKSAKLEPLLGLGVQLQVIDGPVKADGYDWYFVQAIGWPHRGWVAAADHDGAAWIEDHTGTPSPALAFTADEEALVAGLRADAAVDCAPRRKDLPALAVAGVECRVNGAVVARVGAYLFPDAKVAATTYLARLDSYGVAPASGDCPGGTSGDVAWMPGDGQAGNDAVRVDLGDTGLWVVGRSGCFLDENGTANVRVTCGSTYVGVLGRDADLAAVHRWVWMSPDGPRDPGNPPGICKSGG